jgi:two-component system, chemotaxis family, sensor kinase CheA
MDDLTKEELDQLLAVFRDQSLQILEEMSQDLLALESGTVDKETMTRLRRAAHTIKGDSACIGLQRIAQVAHKIEDAFDAVVSGSIAFERRSVGAVLNCLDAATAAIAGDTVRDITAEQSATLIEALSQIPQAPADLPSRPAAADNKPATRRQRDYVRVEASKIDTLLNLAGEMVIAHSAISQLGSELERVLPKNEIVSRFGSATGQMGKLIAEQQKSGLKMRMVTVDHVFRRFTRPIRELAAEREKEVELQMSGGDTELDRAFVDLLYEPMLHLLRNAIDHGIETREERSAAGKPETGRIALRAYHEGNRVVIEVSDDGRGIDPEVIKARAIEAGEITEQASEEMAEEDALDLIFLEGLSTAKEITQLSGRGVGAAAVKSVIEQLRGNVTVSSRVGVGTCFTLRMPLTLAIVRGLLFTASGKLFALPLLAVSEIARGERSEIVNLHGIENYRLRDRFISLVRPGEALAFEKRNRANSRAERFFIIVITVANKQYGIVADELLDERELVIKPLDSEWVQNEALSGASVLGDGRVALIMDAEAVFRKAIKRAYAA